MYKAQYTQLCEKKIHRQITGVGLEPTTFALTDHLTSASPMPNVPQCSTWIWMFIPKTLKWFSQFQIVIFIFLKYILINGFLTAIMSFPSAKVEIMSTILCCTCWVLELRFRIHFVVYRHKAQRWLKQNKVHSNVKHSIYSSNNPLKKPRLGLLCREDSRILHPALHQHHQITSADHGLPR